VGRNSFTRYRPSRSLTLPTEAAWIWGFCWLTSAPSCGTRFESRLRSLASPPTLPAPPYSSPSTSSVMLAQAKGPQPHFGFMALLYCALLPLAPHLGEPPQNTQQKLGVTKILFAFLVTGTAYLPGRMMPSYCGGEKKKKWKSQVRKYHQVKVQYCCAENWVTTFIQSQPASTDMKHCEQLTALLRCCAINFQAGLCSDKHQLCSPAQRNKKLHPSQLDLTRTTLISFTGPGFGPWK